MPALSKVTADKKRIILEDAIVMAEESVYRSCVFLGRDPLTVGDTYPVTEASTPIEIQLSQELDRLQMLKDLLAEL